MKFPICRRWIRCFIVGIALSGCTASGQTPEQRAELQQAISSVDTQIAAAKAEDARYASGLIKALIASRIATLEQTKAMLEQRVHASSFSVALRYNVDGKPFVPPADAQQQLASVESELATLRSQITKQEAEAARYSGGLVQAMALSTLATTRQTEAMLEQKRLSLKYGLPQYIGFGRADSSDKTSATVAKPKDTASGSPAPLPGLVPTAGGRLVYTDPSTTKPETAAKPETLGDLFQIVSIDAKVTEKNNTWWRYAWKLTLHNNTSRPLAFRATIEFQDRDGFIIDSSPSDTIMIQANADGTGTGYALIRVPGAQNVGKTLAKVELVGR